MTSRLYYDDPYSREFEATVVRVEPRERGQAVWLNRSSFYPTSGGQPFDTGLLNDTRVIDVVDEDGDVVHITRDGRFASGAAVHGSLDWVRRFDHMQQHTGQHMLSAAFVRIAKVPTVSFHLGAELSTIDLASDVSADAMARAEDEANRVVWENRRVGVRYSDAADAKDLGLRKQSRRAGTLRLIDIEDFDLSACGGSHVSQTGAVGVIVITGWERFKGGLRVEFACGGRAVRRHRTLRDSVATSVRHLSVLPQELPGAIERLRGELRQQKRALLEQDLALAQYRAEEFAKSAEEIGGVQVVVRAVDADASGLKALASAIVTKPGYAVVLVATTTPSAIVAMRSGDVSVPSDAIVRAMCERFGGRGGGKPDLAQGGGLIGSPEELLAEIRRHFAHPAASSLT